jgi:hypothetical protein
MENEQYPSWKHAMTYGLYLGVVLIVLSLIYYLLDVFTESWTGYISYIILLIGILFSQIKYRDDHLGGYITFGQSFSTGFLTGLFAAILTAIFSYFFMSYLGEDFIETLLEKTMTELESNPNLTDEQIDQTMNMTRKFMTPGIMTAFSFFGSAIVALILSLIAAIFTKRADNSLEPNI